MLSRVQHRDIEKATMMSKLGRSLIPVPFWWRGDTDSLAATIRVERPDLLLNYGTY